MKKQLFLLIMLFTAYNGFSQEEVNREETNTWFTILNRLTVNSKWSFSNELHERQASFLNNHATFLWRPSVDFHLNKDVEFSFGYSYINNRIDEPAIKQKSRVENNIWEQFLLKHRTGKVNIQHRFRQEHRWFDTLTNEVEYANRFRYRITVNTPIKTFESGKEIFFQGFDEIWISQTDNLAPKDFSRNWLYLGFGYKFNAKTNLQLGYMNQWDVLGNDSYRSTPIIQTTFVRNFDL